MGPNYFADKVRAAITAAKQRAEAEKRGYHPPSVSPLPTEIATLYGDMTILPVIFAAAGNLLILQRPRGFRALLTIVNTLAANPINFAFNRAADNVSGIPIPAAGNAFFDTAVPQGEVNVFSPVAGTILVGFIDMMATTPEVHAS
jgi:hypothetical protein